jgi:hypothetical protein
MLSEQISEFMELYKSEDPKIKFTLQRSYGLIADAIPGFLRGLPTTNGLMVAGSEGMTRRAFCPWVCIMDPRITGSPLRGIYVAILFRKDMTGFYMALTQGMEFFSQTFDEGAEEKMAVVTSFFKSKFSLPDFSDKIDLRAGNSRRPHGYESATVFAKLYQAGGFTDESLESDLSEVIDLYRKIVGSILPGTYEKAVTKIADSEDESLIRMSEAEKALRSFVSRVEKRKKSKKKKKIDFVAKAMENARIGKKGELIVLDFEKKRLASEGHKESIRLIKYRAEDSDSYGYDIKSFIFEKKMRESIYIEVKATTSPSDIDFFISKNEVVKSNEYGKFYFLFRVFDCDSPNPKCYYVRGPFDGCFDKKESSIIYQAHLKNQGNRVFVKVESIK